MHVMLHCTILRSIHTFQHYYCPKQLLCLRLIFSNVLGKRGAEEQTSGRVCGQTSRGAEMRMAGRACEQMGVRGRAYELTSAPSYQPKSGCADEQTSRRAEWLVSGRVEGRARASVGAEVWASGRPDGQRCVGAAEERGAERMNG